MPCIFIDNMPAGFIFNRESIRGLHDQLLGDVATRFEIHVYGTANYTILDVDGMQRLAEDVHVRIVGYPRKPEWCEKVAYNIHKFLLQCGAKGTDITFSPCDSPATGNILFYVNGELVEPSN